MSHTEKTTDQKEIIIERIFNASREQVWQTWTEAKHVEQWFGPRGFTTEVAELDLRPGGKSLYIMKDQEGNEYPSEGVFKEIVAQKKIVSTDEFGEDEQGNIPDDVPTGMIVTTSFDDDGDDTRLTIQIMHQSVEDRKKHEEMGVVDGWNESLDKLEEYLEK